MRALQTVTDRVAGAGHPPVSRSAAVAPRDQPETERSLRLTAYRAVSLVAAIGLFGPLLQAWNAIVVVPATGIAVVALFGATLWMICALAVARTEAELERLDRWLLVLALLALGAWAAATLHKVGVYSTDEAAFLQGAANLLLHGHNPYGANLTASLSAYGVPSAFWTYTTNGGFVTTLGYPALPVLLVAPFVQLTGGGQAVPIADMFLLALGCLAMFRALPSGVRGLAPIVCVGFPSLSTFAFAGMDTIMMMAALVVVAYRWRSIGASGRIDRHTLTSALALGLAFSTNQLSWFIAPFLIAGVFMSLTERYPAQRAAKLVGSYLAIAVATFTAVNAPFIVDSPGAWLSGVLAPLTQHSLPYGQGAVSLTLYAHLGGGAMAFYSYAGGFLLLALLAVYVLEFDRLYRCCFVFPAVALFFGARSLSGYWIMLVAVIIVAVVSGDAGRGPKPMAASAATALGRVRVPRSVVLGSLFLPASVCLAVALSTPAPFHIQILSARSVRATDLVRQLRVSVANTSERSLRPRFATNARGQASPFWSITQGPAVLAPHSHAIYTLSMSDETSMPANGEQFVLQAVTDAPLTVSSSPLFMQGGPVPQLH